MVVALGARVLLLFLVLIILTCGVKGAKKVADLDEACLPALGAVLEEVGLGAHLEAFETKLGVDRTLSLLRWGKTDVHINARELLWTRAASEALLAKIAELTARCERADHGDRTDAKLAALRAQRAQQSYGRVYVGRSTASFEFKKAWFGLEALPEDDMPLVRAVPPNGCGTLATSKGNRSSFFGGRREEKEAPDDDDEDGAFSLYRGVAVLADRGGCTFVEKAWAASFAGARALLIVNGADAPFERPASGHVTDEVERATPRDLAVVLVPFDAGAALRPAAAAALLVDASFAPAAARDAWVGAAQERPFFARGRRDSSRAPWDPADATRVRLVPVKCAAGQPDCKPLLPTERALDPDVASGLLRLHPGGDDDDGTTPTPTTTTTTTAMEFVTSVWGGILPDRALRIVRANPPHLCGPAPNKLCRWLGGFACTWTGFPKTAATLASQAQGALVVADRGACPFGEKAHHAADLGAAALVVVERGSRPLLRMGVRVNATHLVPPIPALVVDAHDGARLIRAAAQMIPNATAQLDLSTPPFADKWLELAEAEPWPDNEVAARLLKRRLEDANAQSPARLRWLEASFATRETCAGDPGTCAD